MRYFFTTKAYFGVFVVKYRCFFGEHSDAYRCTEKATKPSNRKQTAMCRFLDLAMITTKASQTRSRKSIIGFSKYLYMNVAAIMTIVQ